MRSMLAFAFVVLAVAVAVPRYYSSTKGVTAAAPAARTAAAARPEPPS